MSTEAKIERFILDELLLGGNGRAAIDPDEPLVSSQILDSLALLRLILFLEEQFGITIDDGELVPDNFQTINLVKTFIDQKKAAPQAGQPG